MGDSKRAKSSKNLEQINQCSRDIDQCRRSFIFMAKKGELTESTTNHQHTKELETIHLRMKRLYLTQQGQLLKMYSNFTPCRAVPEIPAFPKIGMDMATTPQRAATAPATRRS